jgi:CheY-like chemotaxis protein/anti-sigma regulatory factor (Ser/Thr protein kinase)
MFFGRSGAAALASDRSVVLVVDDEPVSRAIVAERLRARFSVLEASSGPEAIALVSSRRVDVVVMDIKMPVMDGIEATQRLKALDPERFLPVVLMTATNDEGELGRGLAHDADDFLVKPVSRVLLEGKLLALLRSTAAYDALRQQNRELGARRARAERDYDVARGIFARAARRSRFDLPDLDVKAIALEQFNGDFVLAACTGGRLRLLVGDFAGHGLGAAVGALPVSELFYSMTERGMALSVLVRELGAKLHRMMPRDLFLAACLVDVDLARGRLWAWNAGLPDALVFDRGGRLAEIVPSVHVPLGVLPLADLDSTLTEVAFPAGARLAIYSDGLAEARSPDGDLFGEDRIITALEGQGLLEGWASGLWPAFERFRDGVPADDDVTFVGVAHTDALAAALVAGTGGTSRPSEAADSGFEVRLGPALLRAPDPLAAIHAFIGAAPALEDRAGDLSVILGELFSNAVEHGLLGLDSSLRDGPGGYEEYYRRRAEGLASMTAGAITIAIEIFTGAAPAVTIMVSDTGSGFSLEDLEPRRPNAKGGRGLKLVRELADRLDVADGGRTVTAVMALAAAGPEAGVTAMAAPPEAG